MLSSCCEQWDDTHLLTQYTYNLDDSVYTDSLANSCNQYATNIIGQGRKKFIQRFKLMTNQVYKAAISSHHIHYTIAMMYGYPSGTITYDQILFEQAISCIATFWPKMFGLHQAEAQNFLKICSDQHQGLLLIIGVVLTTFQPKLWFQTFAIGWVKTLHSSFKRCWASGPLGGDHCSLPMW